MSTSDPTARRTAAPIPGPLPAAVSHEGTGTAAPVVATGTAVPPSTVDAARAASDLRGTEASREGASTTSARDAYRGRVDRLRERIRSLGSESTEAARGTSLTEILAEARSLETSGDANYVVDDLIAMRSCYRSLSDRARSAGLSGRPDFGSIATSLTRVEGTMRAVRDIFRTAVRPGSTYSARDRLHMSRLAIRLSQDLTGTETSNDAVTRESAELITDYRNELTLLRGVGSSDLPDRDRADRLGQDMTALFELRGRLRQCTTHAWIENHDVVLITDDAERQIGELYTLMRDYANDLHNSLGFIESSHAHDAVDRLMSGIIEGEREALVPRLSAEGLTEYCRLSATAEASLERARGLTNPAERRTALAEALQGFVSLGDTSRVDEVYNAMVASLPADASDTLRLQVFTAMGSILHGSGMEAERRLRDLASPIARHLAETPTPEMFHREIEADETIGPGGMSRSHTVSTSLVNERAYLDTAASVLAARSFFSAIGDSSAASGVDERLRTLRDQMDSQIGGSSGRLRTELAASAVEIDMAVDGTASSGHLGAWRDAIRSATGLPTDERLAQTRALVRVATLCRREAESSGTSRPELAEIDSFATTLIGDIAADRIRQLTADHHVDAEFSAAVTADFRSRLTRAVSEGDGAWLGAISESAIDQFANLSQSGHVLLSGLHTPPTRSELQSCLQASAVFARLGLSTRVTEAMAPLLTHAEGITDLSQRANFYLSLGQILQEGGMTTEANQMLGRIAALDGPEAPRDLHRIAEMVPAMREMNLGHLDRARDLLASIHGNPRATEMLHNVEGAMRRSRSLQVLDALRMVAADYVTQETGRGATPNAAEINRAFDEAQRLITSGRCSSVREALSRFGDVSLRNFLLESSVAGAIDSLLDSSASIASTDDAFSDQMLAFASALPDGRFYSSASQIGNLLTRNPHTRDRARSMVDGIPGTARMDGILTEIGNMSIIFAESDSAALRSGVVTLATFGLGRVAAAGAELAFAAYATESAIASSMALRATGFLVRSTAEAATFTLSSMAFESLFSGRTDNWTLANFGRQFGAMMVTFMLCHGIGMATSGLGRAAARTSLLGEAAAEGSGRTLSLTGRAVMGTVGYGATITGLTGVEYLNEALGLHPSEGNVPFLTRLLGSAVMDAQMRMAGRLFNGLTGGAVERWEGTTRRLYDIHELLPAVERLGFGRPDSRGDLNPEQALVLNALLARVAAGESASAVAASIGREDPDLSRITSMVLGIDARSAEGRTMQALLFHYRATHPDANLAEAVGNLQLEAGRLARASGLREGPEYEIVRAELFRRALRSGSTAEDLRNGASAFTGMRAGLEGIANGLLGAGGASSLEGQRLIGRLLLRSLGSPEGLSVEGSVLARVREQVRGMGLDPTSATGRRMAADLLLARLDSESPALSLGSGTETGGSRLEGGVLHIDFRTPGFRHIPIAGHGEVWFGETAAPGEFRFDNHTGETVTVIRARDLPEGSEHSMTETIAPETADAPPGHTILRPGDRLRFADGREMVIGEAMRPAPAAEPAHTESTEGAAAPVRAGSEDETAPGTPRARRGTAAPSPGSEDATLPGTPRTRRPGRDEAPVIPLHAAEPVSGEPDLLAAFRHADPSEPPSRGLLHRAFALADRLTRELGLNPSGDGGLSRAFRAALARRAAEGPITATMLREIRDSFRTLDRSLNTVDPLMRTEVRRRLFTRMLNGEITPERARDLAQQLRNGEARIETAAEGGLTITAVPAEGRPAARALAERRLFDHLLETHFPEELRAQLREGFENGQVTLARVETAVESLTAIRRFIADTGTEPSSETGHRLLNRVVLELATGRMEVREGRVARVVTEPASGTVDAGPIEAVSAVRAGDDTAGTAATYRVRLRVGGESREVSARLSPDVSAARGGAEANLRNALSFVDLGREYPVTGGGTLRFTGEILGQGSASTVFAAEVRGSDGTTRRVAVKIRTHADPGAAASDPHFDRAAFDRGVADHARGEADRRRSFARIDPAFAGLGSISARDSTLGIILPALDGPGRLPFTRVSDLPTEHREAARLQMEALIRSCANEGIRLNDVEFVYDSAEGRVHLMDLEGVEPNAFNPADETVLSRETEAMRGEFIGGAPRSDRPAESDSTRERTAVGRPRDRPAAPDRSEEGTVPGRVRPGRAAPPVGRAEDPSPVSDGSLPASFNVETRRYVVQSAEVAGTGLGRGEILINLDNPPFGRTPVFSSLLSDTRAFAESARIPEPRRFIYTPDNNIVIEFESGGTRRRIFLQHPDIGRFMGGPAAAPSRLEGDTLHLDFSNSSTSYANVRIPNREGTLRFVEGDTPGTFNVKNFSGEPFTVVRAASTRDLPPTELVLPETTDGRSRDVEVRPGDRIRFADGREITLSFERPAERTRSGDSPPPHVGPGDGAATAVARGRGRTAEPSPPPDAGGETTAVLRPRRGATDAPVVPNEPIAVTGSGGGTPSPAPLSDPVPLSFVAGPGGIHQAELAGAQVTLEANGMVSVGHPDHEVRVDYRGETHTVPADEAFVLGGFREGEIVGINGRYFARAHHGFREVAAPPTVEDIMQRFRRGERITTASGGHFSSVFDLGDGRMVKVGETLDRQAILDNEQTVLATIHFNIAEHPEIYGALSDFVPALIGRPDPAMLLLSRVPGRTLESIHDENPAALRDIPSAAWDRFRENLALLNRMGIHHGDMSLSNILWDGTTLRLIDFGQARFVEALPGARESWDSNMLHRMMGPLDPRFARVRGTRVPTASDFERTVDAPELGFHPVESRAETAPEAPAPLASTILPPPPVAEETAAPLIPLRPSIPTVAEAPRIAALATDVAVMGDTVLIGEEVFQLQTAPADAVLGEVPPVARTVFRFTNTTIDLAGSGRSTGTIALALPTTYTAEDAARMISRLSPLVRRSLGRLDPAAAGRIVEMSERMRSSPPTIAVESYSLPASEGGGNVGNGVGGNVVCTGEIVGVGSGRTTFRGYVVEADGTRRPVALVTLTHSMGGTFDSEAANLSRLAEAGVGEVRFDGTVRLDGRRALVVNLAEGAPHMGMGDLPPRDRADFNVLMARDLARMSIAGLTSSVGTDFQYVWGRDSRGRPHLQWIDTEASVLPIDDARSAALRTRLGRETLTAQDWYLENLRGFGLYDPSTERFSDGVPHTFQEALRASPGSAARRTSSIPPPPS